MAISLTPATQKLIEDRMKETGLDTPDEVVRIALQTLEQVGSDELEEDLDDETWAAIDRAEEQYRRGEGVPLDEAFERVRREQFGS